MARALQSYLAFKRLQITTAWQDFWAFIRHHLVGMSITLLGGAITLPAVKLAGADPMGEAMLLVLYSFVGPSVILACLFIGAYLNAPAKLYEEANSEISDLKAKTGEQTLDLSGWRDLDPIELRQAAFLWCGKPPAGNVESDPEVYLQFQKLKRAIESGQLMSQLDGSMLRIHRTGFGSMSSPVKADTMIRHRYIRKYCESIGERPAAFFDGV